MTMLTQSEETSLMALADNDGSAFTKLYVHYFPRVYNYVYYRVNDSHAADDLTSQIFEKLFSKREYYQAEKAVFSAWLFSIARNTITDYYRSRTRTRFTSLEITAEIINSEPNPSDVVVLNETQQYVRNALTSLNRRDRDIIGLKFWSDLSNKDIAKFLDISESNVGVILFRALKRLRSILESQGMNVLG